MFPGSLRIFAALAAFAALAPVAVAAASSEVCERRFFMYDRAVLMFSSPGEDLVVSPNVGTEVQSLYAADCITRERDLTDLAGLAGALNGTLLGERGPAIRPVSLHVGIVPGFATEAQVRMFFGALGYRVRGIGAPTLGRRIYLGPFTTEAGLAEAAEVARRAGFVAPYPRRFGP